MYKTLAPAIMTVLALCLRVSSSPAADKTIGVFVALADNANQGIVPVPAAIGNGDDPERNLYWGTAEGLKGVFDKSKEWRLTEKNDTPADKDVLRSRTYRHGKFEAVLTARAYRGAAIKRCIQDFEQAIQTDAFDMVVFIGHNALMDFDLPAPETPGKRTNVVDCVVLCCKSEPYFRRRIEGAGGRPILLTTQLMYPGAFILHAVAGIWLNGATLEAIRESAGAAYAANQKLSKKPRWESSPLFRTEGDQTIGWENTMRKAVYAGSFDPITNGHLWMVETGSRLFDEFIVAIGENPDKRYTFSFEERLRLLRESVKGMANVSVSSFRNQFLVNYAGSVGAQYILRGIRDGRDYEFERGMRHVNDDLQSEITTVFLMPPREIAEVSSSLVKGLVGPEGWQSIVRRYVPEPVYELLIAKHGHG